MKLLLLLFISTITLAQQPYYPSTVWQTQPPQALGMNKILIDSAISFALQNENKIERDTRQAILKAYANEPNHQIIGPTKQRGGPAGLIIKNGYIVAQWGNIKQVDMTFSTTKSYLSTLVGVAIDKGLITNVTDTMRHYVTDDYFETPHNSTITWQHLLTQSSDWAGTLHGLHDWADRPPSQGSMDDWKNRKLLTPGTNFEYNDVRVNLLAYSLLQVWRKPLPIVLKENIMDPIGASTTWRWHGYDNAFANIDGLMMQSVSSGGHHGGGIFINTLDQARFGLLFLRNGKWKNLQLLSQKWITAAQKSSPAKTNYGYMWWLNNDNRMKGIASTVYFALGFGGNYIIIDEQNDLLVVTRWIDDNKINQLMNIITNAIEKK